MTVDSAPPPAPTELSAEACAEQLRQRFPALFGGAPKPLKLRIQADIRERAPGVFSKAALSAFLRRHTGRTGYLIALTRATHRFDLDGAPADEVSAEHRQAACDELARRRALSESREALLEEQRRNRAELLRAFEGSSLSTRQLLRAQGRAGGRTRRPARTGARRGRRRAQARCRPSTAGAAGVPTGTPERGARVAELRPARGTACAPAPQ